MQAVLIKIKFLIISENNNDIWKGHCHKKLLPKPFDNLQSITNKYFNFNIYTLA